MSYGPFSGNDLEGVLLVRRQLAGAEVSTRPVNSVRGDADEQWERIEYIKECWERFLVT